VSVRRNTRRKASRLRRKKIPKTDDDCIKFPQGAKNEKGGRGHVSARSCRTFCVRGKKMSSMLLDLVGQRCSIKNENEEYLTGSAEISCHVVAADEEWIKIAYIDSTGNRMARIERIDAIGSVLIYGEGLLQ